LADRPDDFALAAGEFVARTCKIGAESEGSFVATGYGTFIGDGLMVTADTVIENARLIVAVPWQKRTTSNDGEPGLILPHGPLDLSSLTDGGSD
jgi:hypothetical protein